MPGASQVGNIACFQCLQARWERICLKKASVGRWPQQNGKAAAALPHCKLVRRNGRLYTLTRRTGSNEVDDRGAFMSSAQSNEPKEQNPHSERAEEDVDKAVEDTFPASDPPSTGGVTRIESDGDKDKSKTK
jgi:hypothetical protein